MTKFNFSDQEWVACLKVLRALKENPFQNPDNQTFKTLITSIYKNAKKELRKQNIEDRRNKDQLTLQQSVIVSNALNNTTEYIAKEAKYEQEYTPLTTPLGCYCCGNSFDMQHFVYARLCPTCAEDNYSRRFASTDLEGRNVVLTGGRVKIGYATCLKLLKAGANLIVTTRFPGLLLEALSRENDFPQWEERLNIYGLDLRNLRAVEDFIEYVKSKFDSLDILINNAAQTIKYTDEYYIPLVKEEQKAIKLLKEKSQQLVENTTNVLSFNQELLDLGNTEILVEKNRFGQPIDLREKNSWNSILEDISMYELLEVNLINQISPYLLLKGLKKMMLKSEYAERFVINVTSSEGQFSYQNKTIFHPHTNMTKAALNMLTRTSAEEFARDGIYMNSVDVGWVSTGAVEQLRKKQFSEGYVPPLDPVDGAARIFHPIIAILGNKEEAIWGKLLKNYTIIDW